MAKAIKPKKKLVALTKNEALGDVATHFWKSGSSMRPKDDLDDLSKFPFILQKGLFGLREAILFKRSS